MTNIIMHDISLLTEANKVFARMPLMMDAIALMNKIELEVKDRSDFNSLCIKTAIANQVPVLKIINELAEQAEHNTDQLVSVLGDSLVIKIYKLNRRATS